VQLRCDSGTLFAELFGGEIEVRCRNRRCGYQPGLMVLHRFDGFTGQLLGTRRYRDAVMLKEDSSGTHCDTAAVRSA
jgi:hypothetical protein